MKSKCGKRISIQRKLLNWFISSEQRWVFRWQSIVPFNSIGASLNLCTATGTIATRPCVAYPIYAFDITSLPMGTMAPPSTLEVTSAALVANICCYQLIKYTDITAPVGNSNIYSWQPIYGINNSPLNSGTPYANYWVESFSQGYAQGTNVSGIPNTERYCHNFADIALTIQGAQSRPTRVTIEVVQFRTPNTGPLRNYFNNFNGTVSAGTQTTWDVKDVTGPEEGLETQFWDAFWTQKLGNPIHRIHTNQFPAIYKTLHHETMSLGQQTTISEDPQAMNCVHKLKVHSDKVLECKPVATLARQTNVTTQGFGLEKFGYYTDFANPGSYTAGSTGAVGIYPDYQKTKWLLVYADTYEVAVSLGNPLNNVNYNLSPSFDIVIRNHFSIH